jgi:hypothetical protein
MALVLTVDDIKLSSLHIAASGAGAGLTISLDADWVALDENGAEIGFIEQKKSAESKLFSSYPQPVRDAIVALNDYAISRIKTAEGI